MVGPLTLGNSVGWNSVRDLPKCSRGIRCLASLKNSRLVVLTWCCSNWDPKIQSIPSEGKDGQLAFSWALDLGLFPRNPPCSTPLSCIFVVSSEYFDEYLPFSNTLSDLCHPAIFWAVSETSWIYPEPSMTTGITLPYSITGGRFTFTLYFSASTSSFCTHTSLLHPLKKEIRKIGQI